MITNLYFVRHAHSTYTPNELERPLSERGKEDARWITELLKEEGIDHVISSPYKRAIQTVEGIARFLDLPIELMEDYKERVLSEQPVENFSEAIEMVWDNYSYAFEGGESNYLAQKRGVEVVYQTLERFEGKNVAIGTHGNIMVLIMNYFDAKYDYNFWRELGMPDIYKLSFKGKNLIDVERISNQKIIC